MSIRILAIDTATEACSCVLYDSGKTISRFEIAGRSHTQMLMPMVQSVMSEAGLAHAQIDAFGCGVGPGSFAGVRIGTGFIKGLALALDRPVIAVNSLETMAQAEMVGGARQVLAAIDARMDEIYLGHFVSDDGVAMATGDLQVVRPQDARFPTLDSWSACGSGWKTYRDVLLQGVHAHPQSIDEQALPSIGDAIPLILRRHANNEAFSADDLAPIYLRNKVALTLQEQIQLRASRKNIDEKK